jgi:hypothetical protein
MAGPRELQYLDISDFSPGIVKDLDGGMTAAPDGSATIDQTYGCVAGPSGGLFPGPKIVANNFWGMNGRSIGNVEAAISATGSEPERFFLNDFCFLPAQGNAFSDIDPVGAVRFQGPATAWTYHDISISAFSYYLPVTDATSGVNATLPVSHFIRHRWDAAAINVDPNVVGTETGVNCYPRNIGAVMPSANQVGGHDCVGAALFVPSNSQDMQKIGFPIFYAAYDGAPYDAGVSTILTGTGTGGAALRLANGKGFLFSPNPLVSPRTHENWVNETFALDGGNLTIHSAVTHGGRIVALAAPTVDTGRASYTSNFDVSGGFTRMGQDVNLWTYNNQQLHFSNFGSFTSAWDTGTSAGTNIVGLTDEGIGPINAMVSMNANQLFLVSANRGAIAINGDLRNPSIINLPGVESTYGRTPKPVATNQGVVYGSKSGIFLWNGSDTSQELSTQLEGNFWNVPAFDSWREFKPMGSMAYRHPYLYVPNEFVYDFRTNSWWRLRSNPSETSRLGHFSTSTRGTILGSTVEAAGRDLFGGVRIDPDQYSTSWSWKSQPITISRNRAINVREIDIVLQGTADVQVYVIKDNAQQQAKFVGGGTFSSAYPKTLSFNFDVTGTNIQIRVETSGGVCKMHRLSIGWRDDVQVPGS